MSFAYSNYGPAYRSYSTFSPSRSYTTAYEHPAHLAGHPGYVSSSRFYSPGRTYTTTTGLGGGYLGESIVHGAPLIHDPIVHAPLGHTSLAHSHYGPAFATAGYGYVGSRVLSPGRTYATGYGLGGSHISTSYY